MAEEGARAMRRRRGRRGETDVSAEVPWDEYTFRIVSSSAVQSQKGAQRPGSVMRRTEGRIADQEGWSVVSAFPECGRSRRQRSRMLRSRPAQRTQKVGRR